jgi:hypothetical protein
MKTGLTLADDAVGLDSVVEPWRAQIVEAVAAAAAAAAAAATSAAPTASTLASPQQELSLKQLSDQALQQKLSGLPRVPPCTLEAVIDTESKGINAPEDKASLLSRCALAQLRETLPVCPSVAAACVAHIACRMR